MKHRIRAAALVVHEGRLLLVEHTDPHSGQTWWVPPGGGVERGDNSVFACARRETLEETNLVVTLDRVVYIREFLDQEQDTRNLELFILASSFRGVVSIANIYGRGPDEAFIRSARFLSAEEMAPLVVYPQRLKDQFWRDHALGFPQTLYLGATP